MLAAVSHDLRTPLTTSKALAHEIGQSGSPLARTIEQEADQLSALVEGLLELSQLNANAMPMNGQLNTVDELIGAALQRSAAVVADRGVVVTQADGKMLVGRFDFSHSLRILVNLLESKRRTTGLEGLNNGDPQGLSEILYMFSSTAANNGSAFAGLTGSTYFYNTPVRHAVGRCHPDCRCTHILPGTCTWSHC